MSLRGKPTESLLIDTVPGRLNSRTQRNTPNQRTPYRSALPEQRDWEQCLLCTAHSWQVSAMLGGLRCVVLLRRNGLDL